MGPASKARKQVSKHTNTGAGIGKATMLNYSLILFTDVIHTCPRKRDLLAFPKKACLLSMQVEKYREC